MGQLLICENKCSNQSKQNDLKIILTIFERYFQWKSFFIIFQSKQYLDVFLVKNKKIVFSYKLYFYIWKQMQKQTPPNTKNNLNVFKRRTALNISSKSINQWKETAQQNKFKKIKHNKQNNRNIQFFAKFQQCMARSSEQSAEKPINLFKKKKKFQNIIKNIETRGGSFYRFGFKSYEKTNKKLFADVLNVAPSKMRGTMHIGQMWSTQQTSKFMRQNKIFINKLKLMDKLKYAKQQQQRQLMESTTTIAPNQSKNSIKSRYCLSSQRNTVARKSSNELSINTFREVNLSMDELNNKLRSLKPYMGTERNMEDIKKMEECLQKMSQIDQQYHQKMAFWM